MNEGIKYVLKQILSARWILTVIGGVLLFVMAVTGRMEPKDVTVLLSIIITHYFTKQRSA